MVKFRGPFHHVATLNLFMEPDGTHEITVSSAEPGTIIDTPERLKPIDHLENLIIDAAGRMKARKVADGSFREVSHG